MIGSFATVVTCMDGRIQACVMLHLTDRFGVDYVDTITEAGMVRFLSVETDSPHCASTLASIGISIDAHGSRQIAVVAHDDCAGNPEEPGVQQQQLIDSAAFLRNQFPLCEVLALWVDATLQVHELDSSS